MNTNKLAYLSFAIFLVTPSLLWVYLDQSLWLWDPAFYAYESIRMWRLLTTNFQDYLHNMFTMIGIKAPLFCWVGEFFSPLGSLIGYEKSLLLMQITFSCLMIVIVMQWKIFSSPVEKIVGAILVASTPIFIFQSHFYFVELLQAFGVLLVFSMYLNRNRLSISHIILAYIACFFFLLGIKITSPFYIIFPTIGLFLECVKRRHELRYHSDGFFPLSLPTTFYLLSALVLSVSVSLWYAHNLGTLLTFAKLVSSGPIALFYGEQASFLKKSSYWFANSSNLFWGGRTSIAFDFLIIITFFSYFRKIIDTPFILAAAQIIFILSMMSFQINEETRYLYPLLAYWIFIFGKIITQNKMFLFIFIFVLLFRWTEFNLATLGIWPLKTGMPWANVIDTNGVGLKSTKDILQLVDSDANMKKAAVIGVDIPNMNLEAFQFKYLTEHPQATQNAIFFRMGFWFSVMSLPQALKTIQATNSTYFITVTPSELKKIDDSLSHTTIPLITTLKNTGWNTLEQNSSYIVLKKSKLRSSIQSNYSTVGHE